MSAHKTKKEAVKEVLFYLLIIFILALSAININNYFHINPKKVLGVATGFSKDEFWKEFLSENTNYIPGWVEIGRLDKASQIDPNYFKK